MCYERWESLYKFINIKKGLWNKVANLNPPYYIIYIMLFEYTHDVYRSVVSVVLTSPLHA